MRTFVSPEQKPTSVGPLLFSFLLRNRMRTEVMAWDNRLEQSTLASCRSNAHKYWGFEFTKILRIRIHTKTEDYNSYVQILGTTIHKDTGHMKAYELFGLMEELQTCGWWIWNFTVAKFENTIHGSVKLISSESVGSFDKGHCLLSN